MGTGFPPSRSPLPTPPKQPLRLRRLDRRAKEGRKRSCSSKMLGQGSDSINMDRALGGRTTMKLTRRTLVLGAMAAPLAAHAQTPTWPSGPVRIVVAYPPGGSTDAMMRLIQPALQQRLGTTLVIENRSGASGSVGTGAVAKSPPDGNSWLAVFDNHAANPFVLPSLPYDTEKDLEPVLLIGTAPYLITTAKAKPYKTLADVIAAAKAKPGSVSYASVGSGSIGHLAMALLSQRAGVQLVHVPYRGGGPAMEEGGSRHPPPPLGAHR